MAKILEKFFESEQTASTLQTLDEELRVAIEDIKKLEEDWQAKVSHVQLFLREGNTDWNIRKLKEHIRVVRDIDVQEKEEIGREKRAVLKIRDIASRVLKETTDPNSKRILYELLNRLDHGRDDWTRLEKCLQNQLDFINTYTNQDIGVLHYNIRKFIAYLKEEGYLLNIKEKIMRQLRNMEILINKLISKKQLSQLSFSKGIQFNHRKRQLIKFGFPYYDYPKLGQYLIEHWNETLQIARAVVVGDKKSAKLRLKVLFHDGLPLYQNLIQQFGLLNVGSDLVRIVQSIKPDNLFYLFKEDLLPSFHELIPKYGLLNVGLALAKIVDSSKYVYNTPKRLQNLKEALLKYGLADLARITQASRLDDIDSILDYFSGHFYPEHKALVLKYGFEDLAIIAQSAKPEDVLSIISYLFMQCQWLGPDHGLKELAQVAQAAKPEYLFYLIKFALPSCRQTILESGLLNVGLQLVKIANVMKSEHIKPIFECGLYACKDMIPKYGILNVGLELVKVADAAKSEYIGVIFCYGLIACQDFISKYGISNVGFELIKIIEGAKPETLKQLFDFLIKNRETTKAYDLESIGSLVKIVSSTKPEFVEPVLNIGLEACKGAIINKYGLSRIGLELVQIAEASREEYRQPLFMYAIPNCREVILQHGLLEVGLQLVKITEATKSKHVNYIFRCGLKACEEIIPKQGVLHVGLELVKIANAAKDEYVEVILCHGLQACCRIIEHYGLFNTGFELIKIAESAKKEVASSLFISGLRACQDIVTPQNLSIIGKYLLELAELSKGTEVQLFDSLSNIKYLISMFKEKIFQILLIPVAKVQTVGTFLCFRSIGQVQNNGGIKDEQDIIVVRTICEKYSVRANDILIHILVEGLKQNIIAKPISKDKELIFSFLNNAPAFIIDLFAKYREIFESNRLDRNAQLELLFENVRRIKDEIYEGSTTTLKIEEKLFFGVLYYVFPPELTIERSQYKVLFDQREDRQGDIPMGIRKLSGRKVKIAVGSMQLKEGDSLNAEAWQDIVNIVQETNNNGPTKFNPAELGIELMQNLANKTLRDKRKHYLSLVYSYSVLRGESLPVFSQTYEILMKYKEFIGDRTSDLLFGILSESLKQHPEQYAILNSTILGKTRDMRGLCKTLENIWKGPVPDKEKRIMQILERNGFFVESISAWQQEWTSKEIEAWIKNLSANVVEKSLIARIKNEIYGEQYEQMQHEVKKFSFNRGGKGILGATKPFTFHLSKRKAHSAAMFNMGVCVATDDKLWNSQDFWQMIIFDEDKNACGGVIYRTIVENNRRYLVCSIQPSQRILSVTSPNSVYEKIIQFSRLITKILKYDAVLIPKDSAIHSNRGSIQSEIAKRNYKTIVLKKEYDFSYNPYHYSYQIFFVV
ncbi:hypothetical protein HYX00_03020 [Candidatus Woesearchaeota archaeon]|nr:hypothetical protein [Candidatus Woesearchaeota archaeon]